MDKNFAYIVDVQNQVAIKLNILPLVDLTTVQMVLKKRNSYTGFVFRKIKSYSIGTKQVKACLEQFCFSTQTHAADVIQQFIKEIRF